MSPQNFSRTFFKNPLALLGWKCKSVVFMWHPQDQGCDTHLKGSQQLSPPTAVQSLQELVPWWSPTSCVPLDLPGSDAHRPRSPALTRLPALFRRRVPNTAVNSSSSCRAVPVLLTLGPPVTRPGPGGGRAECWTLHGVVCLAETGSQGEGSVRGLCRDPHPDGGSQIPGPSVRTT